MDFDLITKDGITLRAKKYFPKNDAEGIVCLVHGYGEHQERYAHVAKLFSENNFAVFTYDQRSFGRSPGKRGYVKSYDFLLDDLNSLIVVARKKNPAVPLFVYGHSFGGGLLANFLLRRDVTQIEAAIISSPWLELTEKPPIPMLLLAKVGNVLFPSLQIPAGLEVDYLSNNKKVCQAFEDDALTYDMITPRFFVNAYNAGIWALENAAILKTPVLMSHGTDDMVTLYKASEKFASQSSFAEIKIWEGMKHELHNEVIKDEVLDYHLNWIKNKV